MAKPTPIGVALQGGASHAAFAWGALDGLLHSNKVQLKEISAISTGAMLAAVMCGALGQEGHKKNASQQMEQFWRKISHAVELIPFQPSLFDKYLGNAQLNFSANFTALEFLTRVFSPYQFNIFDINPFKNILQEQVDFRVLQQLGSPRLHVSCTHVPTGTPHIFSNPDISLEVLLATSCLPYIFRTIDIEDEPYWDGVYTACPPLTPLLQDPTIEDIVIIQIEPIHSGDVPTKAPDILDRSMDISAHQHLMQAVERIEWVNELRNNHPELQKHYRHINVHWISAASITEHLGKSSKLNTDWDFLMHLKDCGAQQASDWLDSL